MDDDSIAKQVFEQLGAHVTKIPESNKKEADWLVEFAGLKLLVEEKTKLDDPSELMKRQEACHTGRVYGTIVPLSHDNRVSGVFRKAARQLESSVASYSCDALTVWFSAIGEGAEAKSMQAVSTLYGSTNIFQLHADSSLRRCYFFHDSVFYRFRDQIDGAFVGHVTGTSISPKLCLNPYSNRSNRLRNSKLADFFTLIDPVEEEQSGVAYLVDSDVDRSDEAAVLAYVRSKYGLNPTAQQLGLNMTSAVVWETR
jgi:hypothetical protein